MTEAYLKEHKLEKTLEAMVNSLKAQPKNPYLAMVRALSMSRRRWPHLSGRRCALCRALPRRCWPCFRCRASRR